MTMDHRAPPPPAGPVPWEREFALKLLAIFQPVYRQTVTELGRTRKASNAKATRMLGVKFRTAEDALVASAESLIQLKVI